jgi:hypothetical protein
MALKYWAYLGLCVAFAGAGVAVYRHVDAGGYDRCQMEHEAALVEHITRAQEQAREQAIQDAEIAFDHIRTVQQIRTVEKTLTVEVQSEIPTDCRACAVVPRARGLLNDALSGLSFAAPDSSQPPRSVPPSESAPHRELPGGHWQGGGGISKVL